MRRLGCLLVLAALGGITVGIGMMITAARATPEPVRINIADLTARQIDINPHVIIEGIFPCSVDAIIGRVRRKDAAWMPAIPATPQFVAALREWRERKGSIDSFPRQPGVKLLIKSSNTSDEHLLSLMGQSSIQGMLVKNDIGIVKGAALKKGYPGLVSTSCILLHEGAAPPGPMDAFGTFGLAAALLVGGLAILFFPRRNNTPALGPHPSLSAPPTSPATRAPKPGPTPAQLQLLRAQVLKLVAPLIRPTFIPRVQENSIGPTAGSRFCGPAALKPGEPWPTCPCGAPMQLFLQLNSADLPAAAGKPFGDGVLQLLYCTSCDDPDPFSNAHLARILPLSPDLRLESRPDVPNDPTFPAAAIIGWEGGGPPAGDLPNNEELHELKINLSREQEDALYDTDEDRPPIDGDKLLGWPDWVQGVDYPNCPRCNTRMQFLFQIDSEDNIPYMFGDCGVGHLFICPTHRDVLAFGWSCC